MSFKRHSDQLASGLVLFLVAAGLLFLIAPLVITCLMAFDSRNFLGPLPPPSFSLHWFARLLSEDYIASGLRTSLFLACSATLITSIAGTAAALALAHGRFPGRAMLTSLFLSPLVVPPVVIGFGLLLFLSKIGIIDGLSRLLVGHVIITLPYAIRASLASVMGQDRRLVEAALILGASERQAFWNVTLPLIRTGIITGAVFTFAVSMDDVAVSLFLSDPGATPLPVALVSHMRASFDLTIAAVAVVFMLATALLIFILERAVGFDRVLGQGLFRS